MKKYVTMIMLALVFAGFNVAGAKADIIEVASFANPSSSSSNSLFTVNFTSLLFSGGWSDSKTGLDLEILGSTFENAWFEMTAVAITESGGVNGTSVTSGGTITFYADGTTTDPILIITFESGLLSKSGFDADNIFSTDGVTITGSAISGTLSSEEVIFNFSLRKALTGATGYTTTAGFTATADVDSSPTPEPATIAILALGGLLLRKRK